MGRREGTTRLEPTAIAVVLASSFAPGLRGAAAWFTLWLLPGYAVARLALGLAPRTFLFWVTALTTSIAVSGPIALAAGVPAGTLSPASTVAGVTAWGVLAAVVGRRRGPLVPTWSDVPWPSAPILLLLGATFALRLARMPGEPLLDWPHPDTAYEVGMVRGILRGLPPLQDAAFTTRLLQPFAYWALYAASADLSGLSVPTTLVVASAVLALALGLVLWTSAWLVTGRRLAADASVALVFCTFELGQWAPLRGLLDGADGSASTTFAATLWVGYYDLPPLVLYTAALGLLATRTPGEAWPLRGATLALLAMLPFHHPTYFVVLFAVTALVLGAVHAAEARRGAKAPDGRWDALVALTPLPFHVLFVVLYAGPIHARFPFSLQSVLFTFFLERRARFFLHMAAIPAALFALGVTALPRARRRTPLVAAGVPATLALFTTNLAGNHHWSYDPLTLGLLLGGGVAFDAAASRLATRPGRLLLAGAALALFVLGQVGSPWARAALRRGASPGGRAGALPADALALAAFVRDHSAPDARFVVGEGRTEAIAAVLGVAERRVFLGHAYHLDRVLLPGDVERLRATNAAMLREPGTPELRALGVDYVVHGGEEAVSPAWDGLTAARFGRFAVRAVPGAREAREARETSPPRPP